MILTITGISGSGKHEVANFLEDRHWVILDADKIAHYMYRPYTGVWKKIVSEFGEGILTKDDKIDRQKLSKIVFNPSNPDAEKSLKTLNYIVHPYVMTNIKDTIHRHFRRKSNIAVIASLWQELELTEICEKILLIHSDPALRKSRVMQRDSIPAEVYDMRVKQQAEPKNPDFKVENNGSISALRKKVLALPIPFGVK